MFQAQADVNLITEYDDEGTSQSESSSKSSAGAMSGKEPIYAVVNLKHKYARRAKKIEIDENIFVRERPNSFHVISGDYEEVRILSIYLFYLSEATFIWEIFIHFLHSISWQVLHLDGFPGGTEDEENIYEPVSWLNLSNCFFFAN